MPKKSAASLSVVPIGTAVHRLSAPPSMLKEEVAVWDGVVQTKPADWFQADSAPILAEYCRAVVMADRLAYMIEAALMGDNEDGPSLKDLLKMRDAESRRVVTCGTKLRLTQQSRYTPMASATADKSAGKAKSPWARLSERN